MSAKPMTRKAWLEYLQKAVDEFDWEAAGQEQGEPVFWWNGGTQFATQKSKDWDKRTGGTTAFGCDIPLYTTPQPAQKPLTDEQISNLWCKVSNTDFVTADTHVFARAIEAAHGIKENT